MGSGTVRRLVEGRIKGLVWLLTQRRAESVRLNLHVTHLDFTWLERQQILRRTSTAQVFNGTLLQIDAIMPASFSSQVTVGRVREYAFISI